LPKIHGQLRQTSSQRGLPALVEAFYRLEHRILLNQTATSDAGGSFIFEFLDDLFVACRGGVVFAEASTDARGAYRATLAWRGLKQQGKERSDLQEAPVYSGDKRLGGSELRYRVLPCDEASGDFLISLTEHYLEPASR